LSTPSTRTLYSDIVTLSEDVVQIAFRDESLEINTYYNNIYGYRINVDGCWRIVSSNRYDKNLVDKLKHLVLSGTTESCGDLADAHLYKGYIEIGKEFPSVEDVSKIVKDQCQEIKGYNANRCEALVTMRTVNRTIERNEGDVAQELKRVVEVEIGLVGKTVYGSTSFASHFGSLIAYDQKNVMKFIESMFRIATDKITVAGRLKPIKPYLYGRATVILDYVASAALFHEISHLLDASYIYGQKILGYRLFPEYVEVYDEPMYIESPTLRLFDDEGVAAKKRLLIENGRVVDLHHTRTTAAILNSEPGSAYGLFHRPVPYHTTLVIRPGDWKFDEMVEDTRRGFYVGGVVMATLEEGTIRLIPEYGYLIEDGELREAVKIRELRLSINMLKTLNAVARDIRIRTSYEKTWLVAEAAPTIRLEAYVM